MIERCRENGLMVASTFFKERCKHTWFHMKFGSGHQLDMFVVRGSRRWNVMSCRTHYGSRKGGQEARRKARRRKKRYRKKGWQFKEEQEV